MLLTRHRYNPNFATFVTPLNRKGDQAHPEAVRLRMFGGSSGTRSYASISDPGYDDGCDDCNDAMPMDGMSLYKAMAFDDRLRV